MAACSIAGGLGRGIGGMLNLLCGLIGPTAASVARVLLIFQHGGRRRRHRGHGGRKRRSARSAWL